MGSAVNKCLSKVEGKKEMKASREGGRKKGWEEGCMKEWKRKRME